MVLSPAQREAAADQLWAAQCERAPMAPLRELFAGIDADDAYRIQLHNIARQRGAGATVVGHKVGLSSLVMQQMMGVDEPDYGHLLSTMALTESEPVATDSLCAPRIEVELAYVLGDTLPGEGCTEADVLAATEYVAASIELIDSRIVDWRIELADTIADNASSAGFVLGAAHLAPTDLDPADVEAVLFTDDVEVARGNTSAVLGNPTTAVAWLARTVARYDVELKAGHVVLPGSCTRAFDVTAGSTFRAELAGLGSVALSFEPSTK